jgi:uncharacterized membrane protein
VSWHRFFDHQIKYRQFHALLSYILERLVAGSFVLSVKNMCTWYLGQCEVVYSDLARVICSFVPMTAVDGQRFQKPIILAFA